MKICLVGCVVGFVALGGCDVASPGFMGIEAQTITVETSTFDVRRKENEVELIRTNTEAVFSLQAIIPRASIAVVEVTGCDPLPGTWSGDHAVMRVQIECAG